MHYVQANLDLRNLSVCEKPHKFAILSVSDLGSKSSFIGAALFVLFDFFFSKSRNPDGKGKPDIFLKNT